MKYIIRYDDKYYAGMRNDAPHFAGREQAMLFSISEANEEMKLLENDGFRCAKVHWNLIQSQF